MNKVKTALCWTGSGLALATALVFGFVAFAARSDFLNRGCQTIAREQWVYTANCNDAYFATIVGSVIAVLSVLFSGLCFYGGWRITRKQSDDNGFGVRHA